MVSIRPGRVWWPHELGVAEPFQAAREGKDSIMLVLSRKKNESIVINDDITIVVVEIRGDKVRLKEVPVHRREVYDAIRRNEEAKRNKPTGEPDAAGTPGEK